MTVNIDKGLAERIQVVAATRGQSPDRFVAYVIEAALDKAEESTSSTYNDPINGKGKPLAQFADEQREKHGLPTDWGTTPVYLTDEDWAAFEAADAKRYPQAGSVK